MAYAKFTISLHPDQHEALKALAERNRMSRSAIIQLAVEKLLRDPLVFLPGNHTLSHSEMDHGHAEKAVAS